MPASDFEFRFARNDGHDGTAFCGLSNSLYARPVDPRYYDWQFFQTPFPTRLATAWDRDGGLAGCYGIQVRAAEPGELSIRWVIDIMVAPRYQRQGLLRALSEFATKHLEPPPAALCVMANERADAVFVQGLGWQRVNVFSTFARATSEEQTRGNEGLRFTRIERFAGCETLLARAEERRRATPGQSRIANHRTVPYLDWRFAWNPRYSYDMFLAQRGAEPFGLLVLKLFRDPMTGRAFGDIVDVIWVEDDTKSLRAMLAFALDHFRARGVPEAATWLQTNSTLDQVGRDAGFAETGLKRFFCAKVLDERVDGPGDASRWFLTMADSEVY